MLAEHFAHSVRLLLAHGAVTPPAVPDDDREAVAETVAASIAAAAVAVIAVWLRAPEPRDRRQLARRWRLVLPPWWPTGD